MRQRHAKPRRGGSARSAAGKRADNLAQETAARIASACAGDDSTDDEGFALHAFTFDRDPSIFDDVGGVELWKRLNEHLKAGRLGGGGAAQVCLLGRTLP